MKARRPPERTRTAEGRGEWGTRSPFARSLDRTRLLRGVCRSLMSQSPQSVTRSLPPSASRSCQAYPEVPLGERTPPAKSRRMRPSDRRTEFLRIERCRYADYRRDATVEPGALNLPGIEPTY